MKRGEVWRVRLPPGAGHAQTGVRPSIILQDDIFGAALPTVLIIPFTSNLNTLRFPATILLKPEAANGLAVPSVALVFQLHVVDLAQCMARLGEIDSPTLNQILAALDRLTGR